MGDRFQVLVVEDNRADLSMIKRAIQEAGIDCDVANFTDGADAIAFIKDTDSRVPDLVVLDLNLPAIEGASVLNAIRASPRWVEAPVLVFTSSAAPADLARINILGANAYIVKPSKVEEFVKIGDTIKEWLEKPRVSAATKKG